jgi:hypothetical protein
MKQATTVDQDVTKNAGDLGDRGPRVLVAPGLDLPLSVKRTWKLPLLVLSKTSDP